MKKIISIFYFSLCNVSLLLAGPGGKIARDPFDNPFGKVFVVILFIIFLPLIIRSYYKRKKAVRNTKSKLSILSRIDTELFDEINLKNRMTDIFTRVHNAWSERDLDNCENYMTLWYRQNQQIVFLDNWDNRNMMNICTIEKINNIRPIHLRLSNNKNFDGTRIMYLIDANMEDYLVSKEDSSVIEGKKGFKDVETVWTLKLEEGNWKVDNIEQSEMISSYMKMDSQLTDELLEAFRGKTNA